MSNELPSDNEINSAIERYEAKAYETFCYAVEHSMREHSDVQPTALNFSHKYAPALAKAVLDELTEALTHEDREGAIAVLVFKLTAPLSHIYENRYVNNQLEKEMNDD